MNPEPSISATALMDLSSDDQKQLPTELGSYELLNRIIPRGRARSVAYHMHTSEKYVQAWCREPEGQGGTGQPNPIDRVCHLVEAVYVVNSLGSAFIPEFISNHHRQLVGSHFAAASFDSGERREVAADLLKHGVDAVNSLNVEGATEPTLRQLIELIEIANQAKERIQAELANRPHETEASAAAGPRRIS